MSLSHQFSRALACVNGQNLLVISPYVNEMVSDMGANCHNKVLVVFLDVHHILHVQNATKILLIHSNLPL